MASVPAGLTVEVSVRIAASPRTVFRYLSDPVRFGQWIGGEATFEPRVGGEVTVRYPDKDHVATGKVVEIQEPERLVFTRGYTDGRQGMAPGSTLVEITLKAIDEGTLLTLRHIGLPDEAAQQGHTAGWRYFIGQIAAKAAQEQFAGVIGGLVGDYIAAWNEKDDRRRLELLRKCMAENGAFRDAYGCVDGIEAISAHIANSQKHVPGMTLQAEGAADLCHGHARFRWGVSMAGAGVVMRGENFARLDPAGKFAAVIGFADAPSQS